MSMLRDMLAVESAALAADDAGFAEPCWIDEVEVPVVANERDAFQPVSDGFGRKADKSVSLLAAGSAVQGLSIVEGTDVTFRDQQWKVTSVDFADEVWCRFNVALHDARRYANSKAIKQ